MPIIASVTVSEVPKLGADIADLGLMGSSSQVWGAEWSLVSGRKEKKEIMNSE